MSPDEALAKLHALREAQDQDEGDPEQEHVDADQILLDLIGDERISEAFNSLMKWYA